LGLAQKPQKRTRFSHHRAKRAAQETPCVSLNLPVAAFDIGASTFQRRRSTEPLSFHEEISRPTIGGENTVVQNDPIDQITTRTREDFTTPFSLKGGRTLPLPHSRPELLVDRQVRAFVFFRSVETKNRFSVIILKAPLYRLAEASFQILDEEDLGYYEPILNREALATRSTSRRLSSILRSALGPGGSAQRTPLCAGAPRRVGANRILASHKAPRHDQMDTIGSIAAAPGSKAIKLGDSDHHPLTPDRGHLAETKSDRVA
jgi:hypothetical protein